MLKKLALATALLASLGTAHAYQAEIYAAYENTDIDDTDGVDTYAIGGKYYLNGVQVKNAPLAEAAFLGKASNIGLAYANASTDEEGIELKIDTVGINGEFFIPDTQFYVAGSLNRAEITVESEFGKVSDDNTGYAFEVGYLPVEGLLLAAGVSKENVDAYQVGKQGFINTYSATSALADDTALTLRAKYVTLIGNHYANFEASTAFGDETTYGLAADLYIDPTLSVGVSVNDATLDDFDPVFSVRAQKFFTPAIAAGVNYTTTDGADSFGINGTFRF
ncbi:putative porin [Acinetobacter sp. ANC 4779]|uniref:putative porin n=1 Tax=Acinetobacter sp. ANC 4779 TaxID=2529848 RepID=UPI00103D24E3|nr:putative porin [Acinetobacter sp. ANC 4779]TCB49357.1 putative porin [Acinetobacter sp. ANC 4779]